MVNLNPIINRKYNNIRQISILLYRTKCLRFFIREIKYLFESQDVNIINKYSKQLLKLNKYNIHKYLFQSNWN